MRILRFREALPGWLCANAPLVYAWFDALARTGTPPAATAQLTPPATCP